MTFAAAQLVDLVHAWLWPFLRIAGFVMAAPLVGTRTVPPRIKMALALAVTMVVAPLLPPVPSVEPLSADGLFIAVHQVLIGAAMGLCVRLSFVALEIAGHLIGQLMGLGFASMVDPQNGDQVPVVSQFYAVFGILAFLSFDGHLMLVDLVAQSFSSLPVGNMGLALADLQGTVKLAGWIFGSGVLIALPALAALFIVNLTFGVMTRATPQLNIFAVGFPIMILLGTAVMLFTLSGLQPHLAQLFDESFGLARRLVAGP